MKISFGIDVGKDGMTSECVARDNGDGTFTILEINQWKHDLTLVPHKDYTPTTTEPPPCQQSC
jgi:hypothetical protein